MSWTFKTQLAYATLDEGHSGCIIEQNYLKKAIIKVESVRGSTT